MSGVFAFLGGALSARQNDIDEQKKEMQKREDRMMQFIENMAPHVASERQKAVNWQGRFDDGMKVTKNEMVAHMYANDEKLGPDYLTDHMWTGNAPNIDAQTGAALSPASQGQANFQATQTDQTQQQAQSTGTALSGVAATTAQAGGAPPQAQVQPQQPPQDATQPTPGVAPTTTPTTGYDQGMMNSPTSHIATGYDPSARIGWRDLLLGNIPDQMEQNTILDHIGRTTGHTPEEIAQHYNSLVSGDYIFRPPTLKAGQGDIASATQVPFQKVVTDADEILRPMHFKTGQDAATARQLVMDGIQTRDKSKIVQAQGMALGFEDEQNLRHAGNNSKAFKDQQIYTNAANSVRAAMGGSRTDTIQIDAEGTSHPSTIVDLGNKPALATSAATASGLALEAINKYKGNAPAPADFDTYGAKASAYVLLENIKRIEASGSKDQLQQQSLNVMTNTYHEIMATHGWKASDLNDVAAIRNDQVVFTAADHPIVDQLTNAMKSGQTTLFKQLAQDYPEVYNKFVKDTQNKSGGPKTSGAPGEAAPEHVPGNEWNEVGKSLKETGKSLIPDRKMLESGAYNPGST